MKKVNLNDWLLRKKRSHIRNHYHGESDSFIADHFVFSERPLTSILLNVILLVQSITLLLCLPLACFVTDDTVLLGN